MAARPGLNEGESNSMLPVAPQSFTARAEQMAERNRRRRVGYFVALASLTSMMEGYDMGIITNAQLVIREDLGLGDSQMEVMIGCLNFVAMFGSLAAGVFCDVLGRRRAIWTTLVVLFLGAITMAVSHAYSVLLIGRITTGVGIGAGLVIVPVYVAEISPAKSRGWMVTLIEVMINSGILLGYLVGWGIHTMYPSWPGSWRLMLGLGGIPPVALAAGLWWLPESPRWLMGQGREAEAQGVLKSVSESAQEVELSLARIREGLDLEEECSAPSPVPCLDRAWYSLLWPNRAVQRMLLAAGGVAVVQVAIGSSALVYYTPQVLSAAGFATSTEQMAGTVVMGLAKTASIVVGLVLFDKAGRRVMLLLSTLGCSSCLLLLALSISAAQEGATVAAAAGGEPSERHTSWGPLLCLCSFMVSFSIGLGPGVSVVASEVFPLLLRSRGLSLCAAANRIVSGTVAMTFLSLTGRLGVAGSLMLYAGIGVAGAAHIFAWLPETRCLSLESIAGRFSALSGTSSHQRRHHGHGDDDHGDEHGHETQALVIHGLE